jgi:hypothetical protein
MIFALAFLIMIQTVSADIVLSIYCEVYKNDTVILHESKVMYGRPTAYIIPGNYKIQILDTNKNVMFEKSIDLNFMLMTDPPTPKDNSPLSIKVSFDSNMKYFRLTHGDNEIFFQEIVTCNKNGICDKFETYLNCPSDCPLNLRDGICINDRDGVCDPDCSPGADPDCITTTQPMTTTTMTGIGITTTIKLICNKNNKCEPSLGENYKTCPQDCHSGSKDGYCDGKADGICDPDCNKEEDIDCIGSRSNLLTYGIVFGVIAVLVLVIIIKSRKST